MPEFVIAAGIGMLGYAIACIFIAWCRDREATCGHHS